MTTNTNGFIARATVVARRSALIALALAASAHLAAAQDAQELTKPTSTTEIGAGGISDGSYKAGEYNGLQKKGIFGIGNIDWRGGGSFDSDNAMRFRVKGNDLGLDSRSLSAEAGAQGKFRVTFGFDELRRNRSDSYQTPYNGAGTNTLTLPAGWLVPTVAASTGASARGLNTTIGDAPYWDTSTTSPTVGKLLSPTAAQLARVNAAAAADVPLFQNFDIYTKRMKYDAGVSFSLGERWAIDADFRPEHKDGTKPMATVSRNTGGDISTVIPDVIDTDTNQVNASVSFRGTKSFATAGYYASFFKNNVPFMSWQNWASGPGSSATVNTMSSTPSNNFGQFNFTGGVNMSSTTKLVANGSYARNTQNAAFLTDYSTPVVPVGSLNGLVVSSQLAVKFTAKPTKKLNLSTAYKYDNRDNQTPVHTFQFADAGEVPAPPSGNPFPGVVLAQNANANRPYSKKVNQFNADADLAVAKGEWIKGGYEWQQIDRACPGSWIDCADAATTRENTVRAEWRGTNGAELSARVAYEYGARRTPNYNENAFLALVPYANVSPASATGGATGYSFMIANGWTGWGPALGYAATTGNMNVFFPSDNALANAIYANNNRISELVGMRRYYVADRDRNKVRTSLTWQASEKFTMQAGLDYNKDDYPGATYGIQNSKTWAANVDGSYAVTEAVDIDLFYTYENLGAETAGYTYNANSNTANVNGFTALSGNSCDSYTTLQLRNNNFKLDPCGSWFSNMADKANTVGVGVRGKSGKLDVTGNFILTQARSDNNVTGGSWSNNILALPGAPATTIAAFFIPATPLPQVTTDTTELRLNAKYTIAKSHALRVLYSYMRMKSSDWVYDGMQIGAGTIAGVLPTNEQAFNYSINVLGVSYIFSF